MTIVFEGIAIWLAIVLVSMLVVAYLAKRWGHDPFGWLLLAAVMGPIAIIALVGTRRKNQEAAWAGAAAIKGGGPPPVVVACDGSEATAAAGRYAASLQGSPRIVLLVVEGHEARPRTPQDSEQQATRLARMTAPVEAELKAKGIASETVVVYGNAGEEIVRYGDAADAQAIIVGRRGAGLSRALLGSVSEHVVRHAKQPVLVVS